MTVFMHFNKEQLTYSFSPDETHPTCGNCAATLNVEFASFKTTEEGDAVFRAWCPNHGLLQVIWEEDEEYP